MSDLDTGHIILLRHRLTGRVAGFLYVHAPALGTIIPPRCIAGVLDGFASHQVRMLHFWLGAEAEQA